MVVVVEVVEFVEVVEVVVVGKLVKIDCEKPMKLETSPKVTKSKRSLHWCRRFYYSISQKVITLSSRRFITVSGGFITLSGSYYIIGRFLLHYRARITVSGVYYIIGWYTGDSFVTFTRLPENL